MKCIQSLKHASTAPLPGPWISVGLLRVIISWVDNFPAGASRIIQSQNDLLFVCDMPREI